jgi:hypothetical protein
MTKVEVIECRATEISAGAYLSEIAWGICPTKKSPKIACCPNRERAVRTTKKNVGVGNSSPPYELLLLLNRKRSPKQ